jgi:Arc/MetJ-type ribon-helix-helix transcriptional regulator
LVSKTVTLDLDDLVEIQEKIKNGELTSLSEFVREAVSKELSR